ncbi:SAM-dependent methyltransferase [Actinobacteria bacterium IMCC26103]|nr:SAM-dependent methyltransferase [Actinobacteria bacterium IMCC26103]
MDLTLSTALAEVSAGLEKSETFVRLVLSGRRRNMKTPAERIDLKPVLLKSEIKYQLSQSDGRAMTTKNYSPKEFIELNLLEAGFANILLEQKSGSISIRITKKGEALVHRTSDSFEADLSHDRTKARLLDANDPFLIEVGISDESGKVKASKNDKYLQVEEFLRLLVPALNSAIEAGHIAKPTAVLPLSIVDLGCGHAYLTFAAHQYLTKQGIPVKVVGIDVRESARVRNSQIAQKLGISKSISFLAEEISQTTLQSADVAIALHACDTATDDAIAWAVNTGAKLALIAPCCHHDIQAQMVDTPEPWQMITKNGIMKERLGDLITDALRMQIMKLSGYRVEAIEFIGGEHTPRNLMIRAVKTGAIADLAEQSRYDAMISLWKVKPALAALLNR